MKFERDEEITTEQVARAIELYVFSQRDRAILRRRLLDGLTYDALAAEFDMSDKQLKRIVYKLQDKIFRHI